MELKELIRDVLEQMSEVKGVKYKRRYIVDEIEFELSLNQLDNGRIGARLLGIGGDIGTETNNAQKVKVKMKPKPIGSGSMVISV